MAGAVATSPSSQRDLAEQSHGRPSDVGAGQAIIHENDRDRRHILDGNDQHNDVIDGNSRGRRHLASSAAAAFAHYTSADIRNAIPLDLKLHPRTGQVLVEKRKGEWVEYHGESLFGKAGDFVDALDGEKKKKQESTTKKTTMDDADAESVLSLSAIMAPSRANDIHAQSTSRRTPIGRRRRLIF